jgi:DNA-directed RNA polymerase subunit K/omega
MLQKGARAKIDEDKYSKFTTLAMEEVLDGLIDFEIVEAAEEDEEESPNQKLEVEEPPGLL